MGGAAVLFLLLLLLVLLVLAATEWHGQPGDGFCERGCFQPRGCGQRNLGLHAMFGLRLTFIERGGTAVEDCLCRVFRPTELATSLHNIRCMCMAYRALLSC